MKKVLSLVLAFTLVLGMMPTAFAAETGSAGEMLLQYKFISGGANGELMEDKDLTREQFAVILATLNGKEEEAAKFEGALNFKDADKISKWAVPYVAYAVEQSWLVGSDKNEFMPAQILTGQEILSSLLGVLGYKVEWANVVKEAETLGFTATEGALNRGQAFETLWKVVKEIPAKGADQPLGVALGKLEAEKPVVTDLKVDEVKAENLKTIKVMFNQPVDKNTIKSTTVKLVKGTASVVAESGLVLSEDAKTLSIVMTDRAQSDVVKLTIEGVKDANGKEMVKFEETYTLNDVTVPSLEGAVALNAKQIELTFSEPVQFSSSLFKMWENVKIDDKNVVAKAGANNVTNTVILTLSTALTEGTHKIAVSAVKDYSQLVAPAKTLDVTVVKDAAAPEATKLTVKSKNEVVVTFNEPVEIPGSFKVDSVAKTDLTWNDQKTEVTIKGLSLTISAVVEVKVEYKGQKDIMNNEVKDWKIITTKVEDDSTLPTVELTSVGTKNKLTFTFSKMMLTPDANNVAKIEILNKDSKVIETISVTAFKNSDNKVLEVTPSILQGINAGSYSAKLIGFKDATVRGNVLPTTTLTFDAIDTKDPVVQETYLVTAGTTGTTKTDNDTVTIYFSEAMDVASIENLGNYFVAGAPLSTNSAVTAIKAASDAKSVVITYKAISTVDPAPEIKVYAVKDLAGNISTAAGTPVNKITVANQKLNYSTATAYDNNTVVVTFSNNLANVDPSLFYLQEKAAPNAVVNFASAAISSTNTKKATFTTATAIDSDLSKYELKVGIASGAESLFGTKLTHLVGGNEVAYVSGEVLAPAVIDAIAPEVKTVTAVDATGTSLGNNVFKVVFTEKVAVADVDTFLGQIVLKNADGTLLTSSLTGKATTDVNFAEAVDAVTITVNHGPTLKAMNQGTADGDKTIKVAFPVASAIKDQANNLLVPSADKDVVVKVVQGDVVAPTVVTPLTAAAATITVTDTSAITFSETLSADAKTAVETAITNALTAGVGGVDSIAYVWSVNDTVVTLDVTDGAADGVFLTITNDVVANITDLVGNVTNNAVLVDNTTN